MAMTSSPAREEPQATTPGNQDEDVLKHFWDLSSLDPAQRQASADALIDGISRCAPGPRPLPALGSNPAPLLGLATSLPRRSSNIVPVIGHLSGYIGVKCPITRRIWGFSLRRGRPGPPSGVAAQPWVFPRS